MQEAVPGQESWFQEQVAKVTELISTSTTPDLYNPSLLPFGEVWAQYTLHKIYMNTFSQCLITSFIYLGGTETSGETVEQITKENINIAEADLEILRLNCAACFFFI